MRSLVLLAFVAAIMAGLAGCSDREGKRIPTTTAKPTSTPSMGGGGGGSFADPPPK